MVKNSEIFKHPDISIINVDCLVREWLVKNRFGGENGSKRRVSHRPDPSNSMGVGLPRENSSQASKLWHPHSRGQCVHFVR